MGLGALDRHVRDRYEPGFPLRLSAHGVAVSPADWYADTTVMLQIICRAYAEPLALRIGYAYQTAHDWHLRVPSMVG